MSLCPLPIGEWLVFHQDTCFGSKKQHLGILIANSDQELVAIPINATSQIAHIEQFAISHGISPESTIVKISPSDPASANHFGKETAFDCNRVKRITYAQLESWQQCGKIQLADYNTIVDHKLLNDIRNKVLASKLVDEHTKRIIRGQ